ncbi:hypothetical protein, partial [uncultured Limnobacter sp.]|uniref:hypothetical protein n=1 Tax=uncultured Limnobacter sp. TaxID=199681 RepID=UPI00262761DD
VQDFVRIPPGSNLGANQQRFELFGIFPLPGKGTHPVIRPGKAKGESLIQGFQCLDYPCKGNGNGSLSGGQFKVRRVDAAWHGEINSYWFVFPAWGTSLATK